MFLENLPCAFLHLQKPGNRRVIMIIESLSKMFQEWRNFIFGWLPSKGRKTEKGSARVWAGVCHTNPCLVSTRLSLLAAGRCCCSLPEIITTNQASAKPNTECVGKAEVLKEIWLWNRTACKWREHKPLWYTNLTHPTGHCFEEISATSVHGSIRLMHFSFLAEEVYKKIFSRCAYVLYQCLVSKMINVFLF